MSRPDTTNSLRDDLVDLVDQLRYFGSEAFAPSPSMRSETPWRSGWRAGARAGADWLEDTLNQHPQEQP